MPRCHYVMSVKIKKFSRLISYVAFEVVAGGGSFIVFSHSSWNNQMCYFDGGL